SIPCCCRTSSVNAPINSPLTERISIVTTPREAPPRKRRRQVARLFRKSFPARTGGESERSWLTTCSLKRVAACAPTPGSRATATMPMPIETAKKTAAKIVARANEGSDIEHHPGEIAYPRRHTDDDHGEQDEVPEAGVA